MMSFGKEMNTFLLIEAVSTLTYLIELSPELQMTASYLEQIIPILSKDVLNASMFVASLNSRFGDDDNEDERKMLKYLR